jgi:hypothetical protein
MVCPKTYIRFAPHAELDMGALQSQVWWRQFVPLWGLAEWQAKNPERPWCTIGVATRVYRAPGRVCVVTASSYHEVRKPVSYSFEFGSLCEGVRPGSLLILRAENLRWWEGLGVECLQTLMIMGEVVGFAMCATGGCNEAALPGQKRCYSHSPRRHCETGILFYPDVGLDPRQFQKDSQRSPYVPLSEVANISLGNRNRRHTVAVVVGIGERHLLVSSYRGLRGRLRDPHVKCAKPISWKEHERLSVGSLVFIEGLAADPEPFHREAVTALQPWSNIVLLGQVVGFRFCAARSCQRVALPGTGWCSHHLPRRQGLRLH